MIIPGLFIAIFYKTLLRKTYKPIFSLESMKTQKSPAILYIEALSKPIGSQKFFIDPNFIKTLPKEIYLCYTIQNKEQAEAMKKALEKNKIKVRGFSQILGCSKLKTPYTILLIAQGNFHGLNLARQNSRVIQYSNGSSYTFGEREQQQFEKQKQANYNMFLHANNVAIIVSTKPGQNRLNDARELKIKLEKKYPEKNFYIFISSHINIKEFENFTIDFWINAACPGLINDNPKIGNIDDISTLF